jgi:hypothetical protein
MHAAGCPLLICQCQMASVNVQCMYASGRAHDMSYLSFRYECLLVVR